MRCGSKTRIVELNRALRGSRILNMEIFFFLTAAVFCLVSFFRPGFSVAYVIGFLTYEQWLQSKSIFFLANPTLVNYSALALVLCGVIGKISRGQFRYRIPSHTKWIYILYGWGVLSLAWSPDITVGIRNIVQALPYLTLYLLLAHVVLTDIADFEDMKKGFVILLVPLLFACVFFATWQYRVMKPVIYFSGMKLNPLAVSMFGGILLSFCVFIRHKSSKLITVAAWLVAVVCLILIIKTESRGQFLALIMAVPLFFLYRGGRVNAKTIIVSGMVTALFIYGGFYLLELYSDDTRWGSDRLGNDAYGRFEAAVALLDAWAKSPSHYLTGFGISASYAPEFGGFYVHNVPIEILAELGLIGIFIYLGGIFSFILRVKAFNSFLENRNIRNDELLFYTFIFFYSVLLSFKQGSLLLSSNVFFFAIICASYMDCIVNELQKKMTSSSDFQRPRETSVYLNRHSD